MEKKKAPEVLSVVTQQGARFVRTDAMHLVKEEGRTPHLFVSSEWRGSWLWLNLAKEGVHYSVNIRNVEFLVESS
jgi:hypothetical protein